MGRETNPRTGQPYRTEREFWTDLATDADQRAANADSPEGREAMQQNARDFRERAQSS